MAIFYRMNALSRVMEDALRRMQIPYQIARGVEFYNRKEIKDVLAYLRVIANPSDEVSLTRIVNVPPRGVGDSSIKLTQAHAVGTGISLWQAMQKAGEISGLSTRAINSMGNFVRLIESFRKGQDDLNHTMRSLMEDVIRRGGIEQMLRKVDPNEEEQLANVEELVSAAAEYDKENPEGSLDDYLAQVSLVSDADHMAGAGGAVTLMTLHAAKGLEFPVVAIIGLEEGCLPHIRARKRHGSVGGRTPPLLRRHHASAAEAHFIQGCPPNDPRLVRRNRDQPVSFSDAQGIAADRQPCRGCVRPVRADPRGVSRWSGGEASGFRRREDRGDVQRGGQHARDRGFPQFRPKNAAAGIRPP